MMTLKEEEEEEHPFGLGVKFCPHDVECVLYLMCKIVGDPLPRDGVVLDSINPYDETQLPALFTTAENRDLFFFTKLKRKGVRAGNSKNADRTVGNNKATWHGDQSWDVTYGRLGVIGTAHTFSYRENGSTNDRRFLITEYHLPLNTTLGYDPLKHHVLCRLRLNNANRSKRRSSHQPQAGTPSTKKPKSSDHVTPTNQAASSSTFHHQFPTTTTTTTPAAADANSISWTWGFPSSSTPDDTSYIYQYSCEREPPISVPSLAMATQLQVQSPAPPPPADANTYDCLSQMTWLDDDQDQEFQPISVPPLAMATEFQVQSPAPPAAADVNTYDCLFHAGQDQEFQPAPSAALFPNYSDQDADNDTFSLGDLDDESLGFTLEEIEKILAEDDMPANQSATPANSFSWIAASEFPSSSFTPSGAFHSCESQVQPIVAAAGNDMYYESGLQLSADDSLKLESEERKMVSMVDGVPAAAANCCSSSYSASFSRTRCYNNNLSSLV